MRRGDRRARSATAPSRASAFRREPASAAATPANFGTCAYAATAGAVGTLLCAFAGPGPASATAAETATQPFTTAGEHAFTVPAGVTSVQVLAVGGHGGTGNGGAAGGLGATATATLAVTPGETLYAEVAGDGEPVTETAFGFGGYGGGGGGGVVFTLFGGVPTAGGGGGASDVRTCSARPNQPATPSPRGCSSPRAAAAAPAGARTARCRSRAVRAAPPGSRATTAPATGSTPPVPGAGRRPPAPEARSAAAAATPTAARSEPAGTAAEAVFIGGGGGGGGGGIYGGGGGGGGAGNVEAKPARGWAAEVAAADRRASPRARPASPASRW